MQLNKEILRLAIPNIIANLSVPILSLTDIALLGHLESEVYLAALSLSTAVFNVVFWMFSFIRMSATGFTAQAYGSQDKSQVKRILYRSFFIALGIGAILVSLSFLIKMFSFDLMSSDPETIYFAKEYFNIRILAAPATIGLYALTGWFSGMQDAKSPMFVTVLMNIINVILSIVFINVFSMDIEGAALGTIIAEYLAFAVGIFILFKKYPEVFRFTESWSQVFNKTELYEFFSINRDIFIRTLCLILVFNFFIITSAKYETVILSANSILLQLTMVFSYFTDGFACAAEALTGKYLSQKNREKFNKLIKSLFLWGLGLAVVFSVIYFFFGSSILRILTSQESVLSTAKEYLVWLAILPLFSFASYIWDGIYVGVLAGKAMRNTMIIATFPVFFGLFYSLNDSFGNHALWIALLGYLFFRGFLQTIIAKKTVYAKIG